MKLFDEEHLQQVAAVRFPLFNHEQPSNEGVGAKMLVYLQVLERTLSPKVARQEACLSMLGYQDCTLRSLWFCKMINAVAVFSQDEAVWTAISRAVGHTKADADGNTLTDPDGKVLKFGVSDAAAKMVVEDRLRIAQVQAPVELLAEVADALPLLPSNIGQHRQLQIDELKRSLLALAPACAAGDRQAIDTQVKIHDRLAKLMGTDQPKQIVNFSSNGQARLSDDELYAIAAGNVVQLRKGDDGTFEAER